MRARRAARFAPSSASRWRRSRSRAAALGRLLLGALGGLADRRRLALAGRVGGVGQRLPRCPDQRAGPHPADQRLDRVAQLAPLGLEQEGGPDRVAVAQARGGAALGGLARPRQPRLDRVGPEPGEADLLAARAHRLEQRLGLGA